MTKNKRIVVILSAFFTIMFGVATSDASAASNRVVKERGSWLAWSKDYVEWYFNGKSISYSTGWQSVGWIFPNIVRAKGITKYYNSSTIQKYRAEKVISAGVPTPWGDVNLYSSDFIDYISINQHGGFNITS